MFLNLTAVVEPYKIVVYVPPVLVLTDLTVMIGHEALHGICRCNLDILAQHTHSCTASLRSSSVSTLRNEFGTPPAHKLHALQPLMMVKCDPRHSENMANGLVYRSVVVPKDVAMATIETSVWPSTTGRSRDSASQYGRVRFLDGRPGAAEHCLCATLCLNSRISPG